MVSWGGSHLTLRTRLTNSRHCPRSFSDICEYMEMAITAWLGIDVAKQKFDVALNWKTLNWKTRRCAKVFRNDAEGWQALLRWLKDLGPGACLPGGNRTLRRWPGASSSRCRTPRQ